MPLEMSLLPPLNNHTHEANSALCCIFPLWPWCLFGCPVEKFATVWLPFVNGLGCPKWAQSFYPFPKAAPLYNGSACLNFYFGVSLGYASLGGGGGGEPAFTKCIYVWSVYITMALMGLGTILALRFQPLCIRVALKPKSEFVLLKDKNTGPWESNSGHKGKSRLSMPIFHGTSTVFCS